jgi:antitoxin VapB
MAITTTTVFINNRTQAVRLPSEARLPENVKKVNVRVRGKERIISPVANSWDNFFHHGPTVTDDFMNERGNQGQLRPNTCQK